MTKDVAEYVIKLFAKLDQLNSNLERIAKALEGKDKKEKKLLTEVLSTTKDLTTTDNTSCDFNNSRKLDYYIPQGYTCVPDGYHIEPCINWSKGPTCSTGMSYSASDLEYKVDTDTNYKID